MAQTQDNVEKVDVTDVLQLFKDGADTIYAAKSDLNGYVATETGKGLSSNDFSNAYKSKLDSVDTSTYLAKSDAATIYAAKSDLNGYVATETGKGLSSNDYTTTEKNKLSNIEDSAQVNVIETVKVNNSALIPTNKAVNIDLANSTVKSAASLNSAKSITVSLNSSKSADKFDGSADVTIVASGILSTTNGGTGNVYGTVKSAASLNSSQSLKVSLNSTSAQSFDGSSAATLIGVGGTLQPAYGGTGVSDLNNITVGAANCDGDGNVIKNFYVSKADFDRKTNALRFGFRIKKSEADPVDRVEYLYDAVGMTPVSVDSDYNVHYADWSNVWFYQQKKPLMLKYDGSVDYYLDPSDLSKKLDGSSSDAYNLNYGGNAMYQIPLCWVKRYEDDIYQYEIVSNIQYDDDYKAYAHIDANGSLKDFFYLGAFFASGNTSQLRSIGGQSNFTGANIAGAFNAAKANGANWYLMSYSQFLLCQTLNILTSKTTNAGFYPTYFDNSGKILGLLKYNKNTYVKMTPEGNGYQTNNSTGYSFWRSLPTNNWVGVALSKTVLDQFGYFPLECNGSSNTFWCFFLYTSSTNIWCECSGSGHSCYYLNINQNSSWPVNSRLAYV